MSFLGKIKVFALLCGVLGQNLYGMDVEGDNPGPTPSNSAPNAEFLFYNAMTFFINNISNYDSEDVAFQLSPEDFPTLPEDSPIFGRDFSQSRIWIPLQYKGEDAEYMCFQMSCWYIFADDRIYELLEGFFDHVKWFLNTDASCDSEVTPEKRQEALWRFATEYVEGSNWFNEYGLFKRRVSDAYQWEYYTTLPNAFDIEELGGTIMPISVIVNKSKDSVMMIGSVDMIRKLPKNGGAPLTMRLPDLTRFSSPDLGCSKPRP